MQKLMGYKRKDGRFGIRNHLLVIPTVVCANGVVEALGRIYGDKIMTISHPYGCTFDYVSNEEIEKTLAGVASNPNVGAALIIGLGCETAKISYVYEKTKETNDLTACLVIQKEGGMKNTIESAGKIIDEYLLKLEKMEREPMEISDLLVGTQCGASDSYSGLTANPALGLMVDRVVDEGGTAFLTELTEFVGAEEDLYERCKDDETRQLLKKYMDETESNLARVGSNNLRDISPGNIEGGLTTLEEKSLGCIKKGGSRPISEVVYHGEIPKSKGLVIMEGPGHDVESMVALAASGAQLCFFTTGRGTPTGNPIMPVIKVSSNSQIAKNLPDLIDVDAGTVVYESETLETVADRMYDFMIDVVNGKETKSEENCCREFAIRRRGKDVCIL
jgi:altronate dehydratase large subunit